MCLYHFTPDNKQKLGPFSTTQLQEMAASGQLQPSHMVIRDGDLSWLPAASVEGLFPQELSAGRLHPGKKLLQIDGTVAFLIIAALAAVVVIIPQAQPERHSTEPVRVVQHEIKPAASPNTPPAGREQPVPDEPDKIATLKGKLVLSEQRRQQVVEANDNLRKRLAEEEQKNRELSRPPATVNNRLRLLASPDTVAYAIDQYALQTPNEAEESVERLAKYLTAPADNDREKVRAIFRWITDRISFDPDHSFRNGDGTTSAAGLLRKRRCDSEGFARLFEALCASAGIDVAVIGGTVRGNGYTPAEKFTVATHTWNAVKLDDHWYLLDVTWAAGFLEDYKFVKHFNDYYFLTPPDKFIFSHLPNEQRWQLLERPLSAREFEGAIEEKYATGKLNRKYVVDEQGRKNGLYQEYRENGQPRITANFKADQWDGPYISYHSNGQPHVLATYKNGKRTGDYAERTETGQLRLTASYEDGRLSGHIKLYTNNQLACMSEIKDGDAILTRTPADIQTTLAAIATTPERPRKPDPLGAERHAALKRLMAYRYLAGVPYANLELDEEMNQFAQAGARLCAKTGQLDHHPKNPGWPEEEYDFALRGTSSSNLSQGRDTIAATVDSYMDDSDPSNIDRVGHRRWCLNPAMQKTGFGKSGAFSAMYSFDKSQPAIPDFDFISYPAPGFMPTRYFGPNYAWSVSVNPRKYREPADGIAVRIIQLSLAERNENASTKIESLSLNYKKVTHDSFGIPNCIIFRPDGIKLADGEAYRVEIEGLQRIDGTPAKVRFVVLFVDLANP